MSSHHEDSTISLVARSAMANGWSVSTWFYSFKSFKGARDFSHAPGVWTMIPGKRSLPPRKSRRLNVTIGASPADVLIGIVAKCHSPQGKYSHKSLKEPDAAVAL